MSPQEWILAQRQVVELRSRKSSIESKLKQCQPNALERPILEVGLLAVRGLLTDLGQRLARADSSRLRSRAA